MLLACVLSSILIYNLAALLGATAQGLTGFGSGTLTISVLALVFPFREVVPVVAVIGLAANLVMTVLSGREFDWRRGPIAAVGLAVGIAIGGQLLAILPVDLLQRALGFVILCYVAINLLKTPQPSETPSSGWADTVGLAVCALAGGVIAGAVGVAPVPLLIYVSWRYPKKTARALLTMGFVLGSSTQIATYAGLGLLTVHGAWLAMASLPAVIVGAWAGHRLHYRIEQRTFARALAIVLIAPAVRLAFFT